MGTFNKSLSQVSMLKTGQFYYLFIFKNCKSMKLKHVADSERVRADV
jgi:hypothetical protein